MILLVSRKHAALDAYGIPSNLAETRQWMRCPADDTATTRMPRLVTSPAITTAEAFGFDVDVHIRKVPRFPTLNRTVSLHV